MVHNKKAVRAVLDKAQAQGRTALTALENKKIPKRARSRTQWRSLWPADGYVTTPEARTSMAWTNWPLFTVGLVQRGYSDKDVQKIIGGNALRVARAALK